MDSRIYGVAVVGDVLLVAGVAVAVLAVLTHVGDHSQVHYGEEASSGNLSGMPLWAFQCDKYLVDMAARLVQLVRSADWIRFL